MQTITHITFQNVSCKTRQQARLEKKYRASIGQAAKLIDNGIQAGLNRWIVVVEVGMKSLLYLNLNPLINTSRYS